MISNHLEEKLEKIERLARGSVLDRLWHGPKRYLAAIGFWRLVYPLTKKGRFAHATTFFGAEMNLVLPSATEIYLFGAKTHDSEIRLARFLMKNLKPGDTFCDVGAHFGYFSLLASQLVGETGRVFSFEASHTTFEILANNLRQYPQAKPIHRAASDVDKTLVFNEFPALFSEYNSLVLPTAKNAAWLKHNPPQRTEVAGIRLDDYFSEANISPQIIKVDVEGAEPEVLAGMERFLRENAPVLVMEYLVSSSQNEAHRRAVKSAQTLGYQVFRIEGDGSISPCQDVEKAMAAAGLDSDNIVLRK
jgi:FkbM family methyltransferase